jgi:hypothetical protein
MASDQKPRYSKIGAVQLPEYLLLINKQRGRARCGVVRWLVSSYTTLAHSIYIENKVCILSLLRTSHLQTGCLYSSRVEWDDIFYSFRFEP